MSLKFVMEVFLNLPQVDLASILTSVFALTSTSEVKMLS